jgi:hypothetical protein
MENLKKGGYKMSKNLYDAHKQWAQRPPDERFPTLEALKEFTGQRKSCSLEEIRTLKGLRIYGTHGGALTLNGSLQPSLLTNWAFSQLCQQVNAPAGYLRTLPAEMTAQCLEHGINTRGEDSKILIRRNSNIQVDKPASVVSAFTSPNYGRIWDYDVIDALMEAIQDQPWHTPPANNAENSGLYASDRDMFVFLVSDENPVEVGNAKLGRGFFLWNSETGSATFGLATFLFNYVCGNHIVWGAEQVEELRIVHRTKAINRFYSEAIPVLNRFVENRSLDDTIKDTVARAMEERIGDSQDEAFKRLQANQFTKNEIDKAWEYGITEGEDVRTAWGIVQGLTAYARNIPHIDKRVSLERRAGALLN